MHKRKRSAPLLYVFFLTVLFFLLFVPLLFPVLGSPDAQEYDYVDNNTSDVDASPDKGMHSNFTAQQYYPDSIHDTLTEENTGGGVGSIVLESYSIYESATGATSHTVDKPSGVVEGDLLIAVMSTDGSGEDHTTPSGWTAIFEDFNTGGSTFSVWYKIAATEPDSYTFTIGSSESCILSILRISGHDPTNSINVYGGPDSGNTNAPTCPSVTTTVDNCFILRIFGADDDDVTEDSGYPSGHTGVFVRGSEEGWGETSAGVAYTTQATAGETGTASFSLTANEQWGAVTIAIKPTAEVNYELDLEAQWTNAAYTQTYEELCIYGGTMDSENVRVDVWTGFTWHNLFTDLSSGWNNISVTDYLTSSTFTIRFKGGTETGDSSQDSWEIDCTMLHIWGIAPIANFSYAPENPYTGETVTFNASDSYDPDGTIVSYFWDFGDGGNGTGEVTTHTYADDGTYTVVLTVTDNDGLSDTTSKGVTVLNRSPIAIFTESAETVHTGESIAFNASDSYDPDGTIVSYFWDFGDGTNSTGVTVDHAYADNGTYTVTLTVTDDDGATDTATSTKTVLNHLPVASFTETAESVYTGEVITFNASSSYDPDGTIVSYFWDFGDGTNASDVVVDHAYADDGVYTVALTVRDDEGAADTAISTKTVLNRPPVALFTESAETAYIGEPITFNASDSYDPDGTIVDYFWDFGDGKNATGLIVDHAYTTNGTYTVTLTVTDDDGASDSSSSTKTILMNEPPVALFTESAETVYTGDVITFNASDSYDTDGTIVTYEWDFGDGANATSVVVGHSYVDDGDYTVTLTVTDNKGAADTATSTKTVLNRAPVASFTESATTVLTGETISFNASASYDPDGSIVSYFWDFGDGTNATDVIVGHTYADDGDYTVTLTVTDDDGDTDSTLATKTILNRLPVASFTESTETVLTGETITFNASDSYDPDGSIVSYFWDFGDGINATGVIVDHSYVDDGNYTVTLTVTDDDGAMASTSSTKTILNRPPVAIFTESATTVLTNELITFNASESYDPDGSVVTYSWDFGDGSNTTGVVVEHVYTDNGNYTVTLTVTDDDGATGTATVVKTVLNRPPVASFTESAESVLIGEIIYFNASGSYDPDDIIVNYFWNFGDGANATGVTVEHSYNAAGIYTVTLTVTDNDGATGTSTSTKTVETTPPVAIFTESAETVYTGETITFNASQSYDPDGTIVSYFWDFGDGTDATGVVVEHAYTDNGNYTVTLTVTDNDDATDSASSTKIVLNRSPIASFTESAETVYTSETVQFNGSASYDPDGSIISYFWDFGDGANATGVAVGHGYTNDGNYTVTLTVTDDDGATASTTASKTILNRPPVASFTESAETVYTNEIITFNASSSYDPDGIIVGYFWDFGDEVTATGVIVSHAYSINGTFIVTLTVTDDDGASGLTQAVKTILLGGEHDVAVVNVTPSALDVYKGQILNVTVVALNEGTITETFNVTLYYAAVQGWHPVEVDGRLVWYSNRESSADFLLLTSINVPTGNPVLTFDTKYDVEFLWDFAFVQISKDGGVTWVSIENVYTTYNHESGTYPDIIANLPGLTGTSPNWPGWMTMTYNLTDYVGETVLLGFRYMTDTATEGNGWYIDNIRVDSSPISNQAFAQSEPPTFNAVQTQTINNLAPGSRVTLTFTWNTTGLSLDKYTISATADTLIGETDISDNTYVDGPVEVKIFPDLNGDGKVDLYDAVKLLVRYGAKEGDPNYDSICDLNEDGQIDLYDAVILLSHYGETLQ